MYKYLHNINTPEDIKKLDIDKLNILSNEIRKFLVKSVSNTGGHLAPNLGVVELTLALHYVFDSPKDKLIWDVGHQSYVHKIITGRREKFDTLRQFEGISGFPKKSESIHDIFDTGHSSTSISVGLGLAVARDIKNEKSHIISIIGDGALTGGMAFEALNHLGHTNTNMIVVLNDNEMSISKNVGSISNYLCNIRTNAAYKKVKDEIENIANHIPKIGKTFYETAGRFKNSLKYLLMPGALFEEMGLKYFGPIDGHDIEELINTFKNIKKVQGPVLVHVITKKGKGYKFAEECPDKYHGVGPFRIDKGVSESFIDTYSKIAGNKLLELAKLDDRVVAITAAMPSGTGLNKFQQVYPERFFDVGIAESHAVTFAAGLAANGLRPYFAVYSTFLQRGYDQIIHDACIQNLPVTFLIDRAGIVGDDGETHHGIFDLSYLSSMPNLKIMSPKDKHELEKMIQHSIKINTPVAIRYPRGEAISINDSADDKDIDKWEILNEGKDIAIIATGSMVKTSLDAKDILCNNGLNITVVNARCIKPLDEKLLQTIAKSHNTIITLEDNVLIGGFGSYVNSYLIKFKFKGDIVNMGWPDKFIEHGKVDILYDKYALSAQKIASRILDEIN
ncbi:1-deoxy-D-xylulose-5-phosphate synthase [Alkalithermobacter thermoalcaliphilus JW-YL-7 = DSM 7308]|uniref:1-deoxy-D-xylulose-5-phosphate synthase n=1 Tax=Alkalithermobacter thermoalcaliphilus JW-YL-7 = DSM 7308 TaxID=1121328 RepID=A0A150FQ03_CLOPD|nr:1-deoxy-D-xylulose-5-phosphate synthase [[Clostridium] paradoxum JW-YL-7 = DSM 7308]SHK66087.1 1-deoxy-D-xylulose-5-phosphate synthase [[Clostridium] paradoxum JW-YL-7 = DSM 7308]